MIIDSVSLNSGSAILVSVTKDGTVMMTGPETASMNMMEVDWLVDALCIAKNRAKQLRTECSESKPGSAASAGPGTAQG